MKIKSYYKFIGFLCLSVSVLSSCGNTPDKSVKATVINNYTDTSGTDSITVSIFGVETKTDECSVAKNLEKAGIIKIDRISMDNGKFQSAIVEFAGVKFGMNKGFVFITSVHDKDAVNLLVSKISDFYGEPEIDGEQEDPEYCYYHWNLHKSKPDAPYIRIRPLHSEEGGLTMIWSL